METWEPVNEVPEIMGLVEAMRPRKRKKPQWTSAEAGHEVPAEIEAWIASLSSDAQFSLFHTAIHTYMPAIVQGHPAARDDLLRAFITRHPEMRDDSEKFELSDDFLMDVLEQCDDLPQWEFKELMVAGNEHHVPTLLRAAAALDPAFQKRIRNAALLGSLLRSVEAGSTETVMEVLGRAPALCNTRNLDGTCLLHKVVSLGKLEMLRALVRWQEGERTSLLNYDCLDFSHNTPLHLAAAAGNAALVQVLLEAGADVNVQNRNSSPYSEGQWGVRVDGGDCLIPINAEHHTPTHIAAEQADAEVLELLLRFKPNLEIPDSAGMSPLHLAVESGDEECVELLLAAGADPLTTNPTFGEGATCLHSASSRGLAAVVASVLKHHPQIDVNKPDAEGWRPLHLAARKGSVKVVEALLKNRADRSALNGQGQTALQLAEINHKTAVAALLTQT